MRARQGSVFISKAGAKPGFYGNKGCLSDEKKDW